MGCTEYYRLVSADGRTALRRLYPYEFAAHDCPAAADAVDDFLRTGEVPQAFEDYRSERYEVDANWRSRRLGPLVGYVRNLGDCNHVVVHGSRSPEVQTRLRLTANHYFVLANIRGTVYVIDAMSGEVTSEVGAYVRRNGFRQPLEYASRYEASPAMEL